MFEYMTQKEEDRRQRLRGLCPMFMAISTAYCVMDTIKILAHKKPPSLEPIVYLGLGVGFCFITFLIRKIALKQKGSILHILGFVNQKGVEIS